MQKVTARIAVTCCSNFLFILSFCPNPISKEILLRVKDEIGPVITISSPEDGSLKGKSIDVSGDYAHVIDNSRGLLIWDLSPLPVGDPEIINTITTTDAKTVAVQGDYLYLANGKAGLKIYKLWPH